MLKSIQAILFESLLVPSLYRNHHSKPSRSFISSISSSFTFNHNRCFSTNPELNSDNHALASYLIGSLKFSRGKALAVCSRFAHTKSLENPKEVVHFLKGLDISDAQIESIAHRAPWILFADVEKTLKPKFIFFQDLGVSGPTLCSLVSGNPSILKHSLGGTLKPWIHSVSKILTRDGRYKSKEQSIDYLVRMLKRFRYFAGMKSRLEENILYLESCGVAGSQLSSLLARKPALLSVPKEKLEEIVSRAVDMNFSKGSRMLVHAISTLGCLTTETLDGRFGVLGMFGFSKDEIAAMFRSTPHVFGLSEKILRRKLDFFLNDIKIDKLVLVRNPSFLGQSLEGRVIPRCKVVEILKSRRLLEDLNFAKALRISDELFLEKYVQPFGDDVASLLLEPYKGKLADTS